MSPDSIAVMHVIAQLRFGVGRYVVDTAIEQAKGLSHNATVCVSDDADENWRTDPKLISELACHGIEVKTIGDFFHRQPELIRRSAALLRELIDKAGGTVVVHAHTAMAAAVGYWAQPSGLVATCHGWGASRSADVDLQDALAYQLCDSVLTYSDYWAKRLTSDLAVYNPKVIMMGLNLGKYPPLPEKKMDAPRPVRIVTVCELTPRKGVDLLVKAMPMVWKKMPGTELHIIGHGESAGDLRQMAASLDPGMKRIIFHGAVAYPYMHLADFDIFALASRSDNLPVVLLEAMLARLPIISTQTGGIPEIIAAAECGTVVPPDSVAALSEEIICMLNTEPEQLRSIGLRAEGYVRSRLDVRKTAAELEPVYQDCLRTHKTKTPQIPGNSRVF